MIPLANHLWQSTLFTVLAFGLTLLLRRHSAHLRFRIWMAASLKFLLPFSLLTSAGSLFEGRGPVPAAAPALIREVREPFNPVTTLPIPDTPPGSALLSTLAIVWAAGCLLLLARWLRQWIRLRKLHLAARLVMRRAGCDVFESNTLQEPGVFGIFRPVLLLPEGIREHLTGEQFEAILAHEFAHVRRRDNLFAAIHMAAQAIFWFHPLVWWIGARLISEREQACDQEVLRLGNRPQVYAESIVNVCRAYVESPVACAAGVTGADLKQRIRGILRPARLLDLSNTARALLASGTLLVVLLPVFGGWAQNRPDSLKFDVASIRESKAGHDSSQLGPAPGGGFRANNVTVRQLITFAYSLREFQVDGLPGWATSKRYNLLANTDPPQPPIDMKNVTMSGIEARIAVERERMRMLLAERFQLTVRRDSKEMPVYALTIAKGGHKLKPVKEGERPPHMRSGRGQASGVSVPIRAMADSLSGYLSRRVVDETGLTGVFDFEFKWSPDEAGAEGPSLFTAMQEQLGLKLESKRAPVDMLIVERVEKPSEN